MRAPTSNELTNAMQIFALANTPLFVVRNLKADPTVLHISQNFDSKSIIDALIKALARKPKNLRESVLPYVYLVALALKQDRSSLDVARRLNGPFHDWYNYTSNAVFQMVPATSFSSQEVSTQPTILKSSPEQHYQYQTITVSS